jgi:hypothetical protein
LGAIARNVPTKDRRTPEASVPGKGRSLHLPRGNGSVSARFCLSLAGIPAVVPFFPVKEEIWEELFQEPDFYAE